MIKNTVLIIASIVGIYILINFTILQPKHYTRAEAICANIGSVERYYELLEYNNFKNSKKGKDKINYKILKESMLKYNKKCKDFNLSEESIINSLYEKSIEE